MIAFANSVLAWGHGHPRELATAVLLAGWGFNWAAGVVDALLRGTFAMAQLGRILRSQLASVEALAVWATYGTGLLATIAGAALNAYKAGFVDPVTVSFIANGLLDLGAGAAGLYALVTWHEVLFRQIPDIKDALVARLTAHPAPAARNVPKALAASTATGPTG